MLPKAYFRNLVALHGLAVGWNDLDCPPSSGIVHSTSARERLRLALAELLPPGSQVWVFGSVLRPGWFREDSDIDIAAERRVDNLHDRCGLSTWPAWLSQDVNAQSGILIALLSGFLLLRARGRFERIAIGPVTWACL